MKNEKSKTRFHQAYTIATIKHYLKKSNKTLSKKNFKSLKTYYAQKHVSKLSVSLKTLTCYKFLKNKLIKQKRFINLAYKTFIYSLKFWKQKISRRKKFILKFNLLKKKEIRKIKVRKKRIHLNYEQKQKLIAKRRVFVLHKVMLNILRKRDRFEFIKINKKKTKTKDNLRQIYKKLKFKNLTIKSQRNRFYFLWNKIHNRTERFTIIFKFNGKFQKKSRRLYRLANGIFKDIWFKKMFHFNSAKAFNGCRLRKLRRKKRASRFVTFRAGAK